MFGIINKYRGWDLWSNGGKLWFGKRDNIERITLKFPVPSYKLGKQILNKYLSTGFKPEGLIKISKGQYMRRH